jgi:hypothetical protein
MRKFDSTATKALPSAENMLIQNPDPDFFLSPLLAYLKPFSSHSRKFDSAVTDSGEYIFNE